MKSEHNKEEGSTMKEGETRDATKHAEDTKSDAEREEKHGMSPERMPQDKPVAESHR